MGRTVPVKSSQRSCVDVCIAPQAESNRFTVRVPWRHWVVAITTYALLATDVLRAGSGLQDLNMSLVEPNVFHEQEAVRNLVANYSKAGQTPGTVIPLDVAYTTHSTSLGLRSLAHHLNVTLYPDYFSSLDGLVDAMATHDKRASKIVKMATRLTTRNFLDSSSVLSELGLPLPQALTSRTTWATHFPNWSRATSVCGDPEDRPLLCEKPWGFFPSHLPLSAPKSMWGEIEQAASDVVASFNDTIDITIVESESDPLTEAGSGVFFARGAYDVVVLARVRGCDAENNCITIALSDHRYEGRLLYSDVQEWFWTLTFFRWAGQAYCIVRLVSLFVGCYRAVGGLSRASRLRDAGSMMLLIPPQVIVYGSWVPLVCYSLAHLGDVSSMDHPTLPWLRSASLGEILQRVAIRMRVVWVLALMFRTVVYFHNGRKRRSVQEHMGVIGHSYALLAVAALVVLAKDGVPLSATLLQSWQVEPSTSVAFTRSCALVQWKQLVGGIYNDVYVVFGTVLVTLFCSALLWLGRVLYQWHKGIDIVVSPRFNMLYLSTTANVPNAAGFLWDATTLSVCWDATFLLPPIELSQDDRCMLMNIAGLTDPLNLCSLWFAADKLMLFRHEDPETKRVFLNPLSTHNLKPRMESTAHSSEANSGQLKIQSVHSIGSLSWAELVRCR